jgi:hypothetical protein
MSVDATSWHADVMVLLQADFMKMPFDDKTFDAVYQIDATCHAPDQVGCYKVRGACCEMLHTRAVQTLSYCNAHYPTGHHCFVSNNTVDIFTGKCRHTQVLFSC